MMAESRGRNERSSGAEGGVRVRKGRDDQPRQLRGGAPGGLCRTAEQVAEVTGQHHEVELGRAADQGKRFAGPVQPARRQDLLAQREQTEAERRRADLFAERARVAREIHDVLAHSLGALGIQVQAARSVLTDRGDIDKADEMLAAAQRMAAEGLTETRRALHALRTDTLPLDEELAKATATYAERYRVAASVHTEGTPRPVPPDATVALLRVAQEALVNAAKHGAGKPVTVRLDFAAASVGLTVRNEVDAAAPRAVELSTVNAGYGLTGMRERLRLLGGTLAAGPDGTCWVVTAQVPLSPSN